MAPVSFAARVKKSVKGAVKYISDFEDTAIELAAEKGYDSVICGHIHLPQMRSGGLERQNSEIPEQRRLGGAPDGLEFADGAWRIYQYDESEFEVLNPRLQVASREPKVITLRREEVLPELNGIAAMEAL